MSNICKYCGNQLDDTMKFCAGCGKSVDILTNSSDSTSNNIDKTVAFDSSETNQFIYTKQDYPVEPQAAINESKEPFVHMQPMPASLKQNKSKKGVSNLVIVLVTCLLVILLGLIAGASYYIYSIKVSNEFINGICDEINLGDSYRKVKEKLGDSILDEYDISRGNTIKIDSRDYEGYDAYSYYIFDDETNELILIIYTIACENKKDDSYLFNKIKKLSGVCNYYKIITESSDEYFFKPKSLDNIQISIYREINENYIEYWICVENYDEINIQVLPEL